MNAEFRASILRQRLDRLLADYPHANDSARTLMIAEATLITTELGLPGLPRPMSANSPAPAAQQRSTGLFAAIASLIQGGWAAG